MAPKKPACPLPLSRVLSSRRVSRPSGSPGGGVGGGGEEPAKVVNTKAFWEKLPWDEVNFFSRTTWVDWPLVPTLVEVDRFTVQAGMVLALTGVVFRGAIDINQGAVPQEVYCADDYFNPLRAYVAFFARVGGKQIMDRTLNMRAPNPPFSGWAECNVNVAPLGQDFAIFAAEDNVVDCRAWVSADAIALYVNEIEAIGVDWHGVWIPIGAYNAMKDELR